MPPGAQEEYHYHSRAEQSFYILSGSATFVIDGESFICGVGGCIYVGPGQRHKIGNPGECELRFLVISVPDSHTDRINVMEMDAKAGK